MKQQSRCKKFYKQTTQLFCSMLLSEKCCLSWMKLSVEKLVGRDTEEKHSSVNIQVINFSLHPQLTRHPKDKVSYLSLYIVFTPFLQDLVQFEKHVFEVEKEEQSGNLTFRLNSKLITSCFEKKITISRSSLCSTDNHNLRLTFFKIF